MDNLPLPQHVTFPARDAAPCPACQSIVTTSIYRVEGIPVHSCVLLDDAEAAKSFPRANLELAHCGACGFLFNAAFDPGLLDYSEDYEETQGYSGTFRAFLTETIERLLADRDLRGQTLLEIGCGRGDFLEQLCRAADAHGVGVDPSRTSGRVDPEAGRGLWFLQEAYGRAHSELDVQGILCRHTLEHLSDVRQLVLDVHHHLAGRPNGWTFFEVPDTLRILNEGAFWDIYYEHCSYFSAHSLRHLFAGCGFSVDDLSLVYAGQYLQLTASPTGASSESANAPREGLDGLETIAQEVNRFRDSCQQSLAHWNRWLAESALGSVALWGSGSKATGFLATLGQHDRIACVVDINPDKHGKFVAGSGHKIVAPESLPGMDLQKILIMNPVYRDEISAQLKSLGLHLEIEALGT